MPCGAGRSKLGPSTEMEGEIEDRKGQDHNQERESCLVCACLCSYVEQGYIHGACCLLGDIFYIFAVSSLFPCLLVKASDVQHYSDLSIYRYQTCGGISVNLLVG